MNKRLRKKLRVGEFRELGFEIRMTLVPDLSEGSIEDALDDFWKTMRHEFTMLISPDGTFAYRPTVDTQMLGMNLDRDMNACWTTSHWALLLCLEKTGVPLWMGP